MTGGLRCSSRSVLRSTLTSGYVTRGGDAARSRRDSWEAMMQQGSQQSPQGDKLAAAGSAKFYDSVEHGGPSSVWDQILKAKPSPILHANTNEPLASDRRKSFERAAANVANTRRGVSLDLAKPVYVPAGLKQTAHPQVRTTLPTYTPPAPVRRRTHMTYQPAPTSCPPHARWLRTVFGLSPDYRPVLRGAYTCRARPPPSRGALCSTRAATRA